MASRRSHQSPHSAAYPALVPAGQLAGHPTVFIKRRVTLIGDSPAAHLKLMSRFIAKAQALVVADRGNVVLADLYADGTVQVNGQPAREVALRDGDSVWIGPFQFTFSASEQPGEPAAHPISSPGLLNSNGRRLRLDANRRVWSIGRAAACDVRAETGGVSQVHAAVVAVRDRHVLFDLGSRNGTYLNSKKCRASVLHDGDVLEVGSTRLQYAAPEPTQAPGPTPTAQASATQPFVEATQPIDIDAVFEEEVADILASRETQAPDVASFHLGQSLEDHPAGASTAEQTTDGAQEQVWVPLDTGDNRDKPEAATVLTHVPWQESKNRPAQPPA